MYSRPNIRLHISNYRDIRYIFTLYICMYMYIYTVYIYICMYTRPYDTEDGRSHVDFWTIIPMIDRVS